MKIVDFKTYVVQTPRPHRGGRFWVFVKLISNDAIEGIGGGLQSTPFIHLPCSYDRGRLRNLVVGRDPFQIERLCAMSTTAKGTNLTIITSIPTTTVMGILSALKWHVGI